MKISNLKREALEVERDITLLNDKLLQKARRSGSIHRPTRPITRRWPRFYEHRSPN